MLNSSEHMDGGADPIRQALSALMDSHLPPGVADDGCAAWQAQAEARACWHTYHLIGDVMRSEELSVSPRRDTTFLLALRGRLALEPLPVMLAEPEAVAVVLPANVVPLPQKMVGSAAGPAARARRAGSWFVAPVAVAAGFVAVAGVLVVTRVAAPDAAGLAAAPALISQATGGRPDGRPDALVSERGQPELMLASGQLVRDARLDRYLLAHRRVSNGTSVVVPGAVVRSVDTVSLENK